LEESVQLASVTLPAVLSVTSAINTPRIAGMRDILAAGKKPVDSAGDAAAAAVGPSGQVLAIQAAEQAERAQAMVETDPEGAAKELAAFLKVN
jgi:electron transfer flavoprotein beta subunit